MQLAGKTVIITGGAQGLGRGIVSVCHREGANVVIADIRQDAAAELANSLAGRDLAVACDVRKEENLSALLARTIERFEQIDGLVNNAGINFVKPFLDVEAGEWDNVLQTDLRAAFLLTQLVCRHMLTQSPVRGSIVNISSVHSYSTLPGAAPYDAAKWGIVGVTKSVAVEVAPSNIRVNCISPGLINTLIWQDILKSSLNREACETYWKSNIPMVASSSPKRLASSPPSC